MQAKEKNYRLRFGVIGVGIQGEKHVKILSTHPLVEVVSICDVNPERLKEVSQKYGINKTYIDYEEMLAKERLDAVVVATPDHLHLKPVISALENGINVLLEKPMATKLDDALKMAEEAKKRGLLLYINFSNRFNPPFAIAHKKFREGELGKPLYAYFRLSDTIYVPTKMLSWASKSSVVFFLMSHTTDLARWIFNDEVRKVRAYAHYEVLESLGIRTPDYVTAVLEFRKGGRVVLESSWILPETLPSIVDFNMEIIGTRGAIYINNTFQSIAVANATRHYYPKPIVLEEVNGRFTGFVKESIFHFVDSLASKTEPLIKVKDGVENTRVLEAIVESYTRNTEIVLEENR
ncbi:MAG: hypothetical protein DRJ47_02480 [Thermoprotei archaeon]|nr:MAG: hypothetical protein DRJ47_02480 [Thermoprotei archaeon]